MSLVDENFLVTKNLCTDRKALDFSFVFSAPFWDSGCIVPSVILAFCDFLPVPSAYRPCAQISNHGRASTQSLLLYHLCHIKLQLGCGLGAEERYIGCFKSVVPNTPTYRVHKTLPLWKYILDSVLVDEVREGCCIELGKLGVLVQMCT